MCGARLVVRGVRCTVYTGGVRCSGSLFGALVLVLIDIRSVISRNGISPPPLIASDMLHHLLALSLVCTDSAAGVQPIGGPHVYLTATAAPSLRELYSEGRTFEQFLSAADSKRAQWLATYKAGTVSDELVARARAIPGTWRLLVIAEDWCGDSLNTMPYVARLVEAVPNLQLRIISSKRGRKLLKAHRTSDGRAATPTVILLDDRYRESGCWVERPSELQRWFQEKKKTLSEKDLYDQKYAWYANDKGDQTVREIVEMLASAAAGHPSCGKKS